MVDLVADDAVAAPARTTSMPEARADAGTPMLPAETAIVDAPAGSADGTDSSALSPERLQAQVAALRRYDARMKGLARVAPARPAGADSGAADAGRAARLSDWHWYREMVLPAALGTLPAPLFDDPAVRLVFAEPSLLMAGLVARALYARRAAVRRCIDRTVLAQLRVALGDGPIGHERLARLQRLTLSDGDVPLPETPTPMFLAHDGLARLRRDHPTMVPVVVHFVLMQLEGAAMSVPVDAGNAATGRRLGHPPSNAALARESAAFFESLPYLIPELS